MLSRFSTSVGHAIGAFLKGVAEGRDSKRPEMLVAGATSKRWHGGDLAQQEYAARRALANSWVYTAISRKSMDIAGAAMDAAIFHNPKHEVDGGIAIPDHSLLKILRKPNHVMGGNFLWQFTHQWLDLNGNAYWFLLPDETGRWLKEIWPLPATDVDPFPSEDPDKFLDYYAYTVDGREFQIDPFYITHFRYPNPLDIYRGMAPLTAAMLPADADTAMATWNGQFFGQDNTMPSAVISVSSGDPKIPLDPADVQALRDELTENYHASARKTAVVNAFNLAVEPLGWNARDMDFLAGREFSKEEIYSIFGVFAGMMDKNATEANAEASRSAYNDLTLWPTMQLYSQTINSSILERFYHSDQEHRWKDPRFGNRSQNLAESSGTAGVMTIDERRKRFWNLGPLPDGKGEKLEGEAPEPPVGTVPGTSPEGIQDPAAEMMTDLPDEASLRSLESGLKSALDFFERQQ